MKASENVVIGVSNNNDNSGSRGTFYVLMLYRFTLFQPPRTGDWEPFPISSISFLIKAELRCNYMTPEAEARGKAKIPAVMRFRKGTWVLSQGQPVPEGALLLID